MLSALLPVFLAIAAGIGLVIQQAVNASLRSALQSSAWTAFTSYGVGWVCMVSAGTSPLPGVPTS
jgi:transporter family-2 protein